jgi:hypothetical protein
MNTEVRVQYAVYFSRRGDSRCLGNSTQLGTGGCGWGESGAGDASAESRLYVLYVAGFVAG